MQNHSPGVWSFMVDKERHKIWIQHTVDGKTYYVAHSDCILAGITPQSLANARLLAAAPTLLAACQDAAQTLEVWADGHPCRALERLRWAITLATEDRGGVRGV